MGNSGSKKTPCLSVTPIGIALLAVLSVQTLLLIPLLWHGVIGSLKSTLPKFFKLVYWFTCFVMLAATISFPVQLFTEETFSGDCDNITRLKILVAIAFSAYLLSLVCISTLYLFRFIISFKVSKYLTTTFLFGILCQIILLTTTIYLNDLIWERLSHGLDFEHLYLPMFSVYLSFKIVHLLYNILLLILFISKVLQMGKRMDIKKEDLNNTHNILPLIKLIEPTVIYTLCLIVSTASTMIITIYGFLRGTSFVDTNDTYQLDLTLQHLDILINCAALNLQFKYSAKAFNLCCGCYYKPLMYLLVSKIVNIGDAETVIQLTISNKLSMNEQYAHSIPTEKSSIPATMTTAGDNPLYSSIAYNVDITKDITKYDPNSTTLLYTSHHVTVHK